MHLFDNVFDSVSLLNTLEVLIKLGFGALLAGAIGWEREVHGRPAGIRTHMLVVIGVVLFTEVSRAFAGDPGRVAAQIVTGIGFLGAGTILRLGVEIKGLTTAASIWASAGIGMAVSTGGPFLLVALFATVLTLFTLAVVDSFERRIAPKSGRRICLVEMVDANTVGAVIQAVAESGGSVEAVTVISEGKPFSVQMAVKGSLELMLAGISKIQGVQFAEWVR